MGRFNNEFVSLIRTDNQSIASFILEFEAKYKKVKSNGNQFSDECLAYKLLRSANISILEERIVKASTSQFTFDNIKDTLKRMYGETVASIVEEPEVKEKCNFENFNNIQEQKSKRKGKSNRKKKKGPSHILKWSEYFGFNPGTENCRAYSYSQDENFQNIKNRIHLSYLGNEWEATDCTKPANEVYGNKFHTNHILLCENLQRNLDQFTSSQFNQNVFVNLTIIKGCKVICMIDAFTKYTEVGILPIGDQSTIINFVMKNWIDILGQANMFHLVDNINYTDQKFVITAEQYNIKMNITSKETQWEYSVCEKRVNDLIQTINKILQKVNCPLSVALTWASCTLNGLKMSHECDLSPSQHVFGYNILLPCVKNYVPPELSDEKYSRVLVEHLNTKRKARNSYCQAESSKIMRERNFKEKSSYD